MVCFTSKRFTWWWCCLLGSTSVTYVALASEASGGNLPYPAVTLVEQTVLTTAGQDFRGHGQAFELATKWNEERLRAGQDERRAPHLACAEYGHGHEAASGLQTFLSPEAVKPVHHSSEHGVCFMATASDAQATELSAGRAGFDLTSVGPFPSALKIAPGVLEHHGGSAGASERSDELDRLTTTHGSKMRMDNVQGLMVELTPGTLLAHSPEAKAFIGDLLEDIMSKSVDLHSNNFWSDPAMLGGEHLAIPEGALRGREWSRAATVVHELSAAAETSPGDICSWDGVAMHHAANDVLLVSGLDHLLINGRGAGGQREEAEELHVACFMGLVSFLAGRLEVLQVAPWHTKVLFNAAARANIQTATVTSTPLTDAGLDGTGEVIQVLDSGLDETSCFFEDGDGLEVTHGHYFEEFGLVFKSLYSATRSSSTSTIGDFIGGDFSFDIDRRKIVQYINIVKPDSPTSSSSPLQLTSGGRYVYWIPGDSFEQDDAAGHGTHTAGSAAGATLTRPADPVTCSDADQLSCVGGCIDADAIFSIDDLASYKYQMGGLNDIDRICSAFGCDDATSGVCLGDDVSEILTDHGGMAQGAKLAIFDIFWSSNGLGDTAGNGLWEACMDAGCKLHSNSYGADTMCTLSSTEVEYDDFMYRNPENLIIFAAGNLGDINDDRTVCTIGSPATGKNLLTVGSTSSGQTRITITGEDGTFVDDTNGPADIDTVSFFSSYGFTRDGRIKPEIVAPGDMIYSAAGDGTDGHSCRLYAYFGTSMSCPIVAGASAMIRQYFVDPSFYATDVSTRGFCGQGFLCEGFSPSSATVKALLINSANLMGGSSEPDGFRGFGRVHLEQGMPLDGEGNLVLFVADAARTAIPELTVREYVFEVDGAAGLDFRVTLSWIDPAAASLSAKQLVHDLDLAVSAPSGTRYTMWESGEADDANVNERVIVDALDVESGAWTVSVSANSLTTDFQRYSLVANGAIISENRNGMDADNSSSGSFFDPGLIPSSFGPGEAPSESSDALSKSNVKQSSTAATASLLAAFSCYIVSTLAAATFRA